jgi:hypothetical protein
MRKLLKKYGFVSDRLITDDLRSYGAAARDLWDRTGARSIVEQPRRKLALANPTPGAQDATLQKSRLSAEISLLGDRPVAGGRCGRLRSPET